jgi:hypothetical protein
MVSLQDGTEGASSEVVGVGILKLNSKEFELQILLMSRKAGGVA